MKLAFFKRIFFEFYKMCFSYKLTEPITTIGLTAYEDDDTNTQRNVH